MKGKYIKLNFFRLYSGSEDIRRKMFEEIWKGYYPDLKIFCTGFMGRNSEIDDICQEIILRAFTRIEQYNPLYSFSTWIFTIARNYCIDYLRRNNRQLPLEDDIPAGKKENPEEMLEFSELNSAVDRFIRSLSRKDSQIAMLRFSQKLKFREIGEIMEIPDGTVRYRISEIRKGLKIYLEREYGNF